MARFIEDEEWLSEEDKGIPLTREQVEYFVDLKDEFDRLQETLSGSEAATDAEDREDAQEALQLLVRNVHKEAVEKEYRLAVDKQTSRTVEDLLVHSSAVQLRSFLARIADRAVAFCVDPNASHIVQLILSRLPTLMRAEASSSEPVETPPPSLADLSKQVVSAVSERWLDLLGHRYGSHVVRDMLTLAAGGTPTHGDDKKNQNKAEELSFGVGGKHLGAWLDVPNSLLSAVLSASQADIQYFTTHSTASPVLQVSELQSACCVCCR